MAKAKLSGINLTGMQDTMKALEAKLGGAHFKKAAKKAVESGTEIVKDEASRRVPRSHKNKAHLADNLITRPAVYHQNGTVTAKVGYSKEFAYASPLEYGHTVKTKLGPKRVAARPALRTARDIKKREVLSTIAEILREGLKEQ